MIGMLVDQCIINRSYHDWTEELAADMVLRQLGGIAKVIICTNKAFDLFQIWVK